MIKLKSISIGIGGVGCITGAFVSRKKFDIDFIDIDIDFIVSNALISYINKGVVSYPQPSIREMVLNLISDLVKRPFRHCIDFEGRRYQLRDDFFNPKRPPYWFLCELQNLFCPFSDTFVGLNTTKRTNKIAHKAKAWSKNLKYILLLLYLSEQKAPKVYLFVIIYLINCISIILETTFLIPHNGWIVYTLWYQAVFPCSSCRCKS